MKYLIEVEVEKDSDNEAPEDAWVPYAADVAHEIWFQMRDKDLDTGWRVFNTKAVGRLES